jgi:hypothetical protein
LFYNQSNLSNGTFQISTFRGNEQVLMHLILKLTTEQIINAGFLNTEYNKAFRSFWIKRRVRFQKLIGIQLDPAGGDDELEKAFYQV